VRVPTFEDQAELNEVAVADEESEELSVLDPLEHVLSQHDDLGLVLPLGPREAVHIVDADEERRGRTVGAAGRVSLAPFALCRLEETKQQSQLRLLLARFPCARKGAGCEGGMRADWAHKELYR
jgi:hypothetical protein